MKSFAIIDYVVVAIYLATVAIIGASFYRKRTTIQDYFLGGKHMRWLPVGISIVAADTSAITLMGTPAWGYQHTMELAWLNVGYALAAPIVILVFIPFYSRLNLFTAYEYLERRFNLSVRLITSLLFQLLRVTHVAIAIYAPSLALTVVSGMPLWQCVLVIGLLTTIYTTFGGMKAVIWTDVIQFSIVVAGLALVFVLAFHAIDGGLAGAVSAASAAGKLKFINLSFDPRTETSIWACLLGGTLLGLSGLTTDQAILQRLFTTRSEKDCARSVMLNAIISTPLMISLMFLGVVLFAFYQAHPERLAGLHSPDGIFPLFAVRELPAGVSGLIVAAIFAASMGVMSASINSLSTATTVDFYQRLICRDARAEHYARFGRAATAVWGCIATALAMFMGRLGELALAYNRVSSIVSTPILGIFLLGILSRRATSGGALAGAAAGTFVAIALSEWTAWSFFYQLPIGVAVTLIVGICASLAQPAPLAVQTDGLVMSRTA